MNFTSVLHGSKQHSIHEVSSTYTFHYLNCVCPNLFYRYASFLMNWKQIRWWRLQDPNKSINILFVWVLTSAHARVNWITSIPATARGRTWSPKLIWQTQQTGTFTSPTITNRNFTVIFIKTRIMGSYHDPTIWIWVCQCLPLIFWESEM